MIVAAKKEDQVTELILQAASEIFPAMHLDFKGHEQEVCDFLFANQQNKISYQNTFVYKRANQILGIIIVYQEEESLIKNQKKLLKDRYGVDVEIPKEQDFNLLYIDTLSVKKEFQGQGIGSELLNFVLIKEKSCSLIVDVDKKKTQDLYLKLGFLVYEELEMFGKKYLRMIHPNKK